MQFVWLSTLGKVRRGGVRVDADAEALTPAVCQELQAAGLSESTGAPYRQIVALVEITSVCPFHIMTKLRHPPHLHQILFWQSLANTCLYGSCYLFRVGRVIPLPDEHRIQQLGGGKLRGFVNVLEEGQGPRMLRSLGAVPGLIPDEIQDVVVRLPGPFAQLIASGSWDTFVLPQIPVVEGGTSGLCFSWSLLPVACPAQPNGLLQFPDIDLELNAAAVLEMADTLREFATLAHGEQIPAQLQRLVATLQKFHDEICPEVFVKNARDLQHRHVLASSKIPFQSAYLLRVMLFSGVLKSSSHLREALMQALSIVLPKTLLPTFKNLLNECASVVPHASTISRWRFILDAAIMIHNRKLNALPGRRMSRVLMADSSVQHGRDFEHIVVSEVDKANIIDVYVTANRLAEHW